MGGKEYTYLGTVFLFVIILLIAVVVIICNVQFKKVNAKALKILNLPSWKYRNCCKSDEGTDRC